jgi:uncharacterized membrane protein
MNNIAWYSRLEFACGLGVIFLLALSISLLTPPFQSPNEANHVKRAYLFSQGEIVLATHEGTTGGEIDTGILAYMKCFRNIPFEYEQKLLAASAAQCKKLTWTGEKQFSGLPNIAYYFPLPYLPQAFAFRAGESLGLNIESAYYLARFLSLIATLGLLFAAATLYRFPMIVIALLVAPMSLFQLGAASLDSITFGMSALVAALFLRGREKESSFNSWMHLSWVLCIFCLATSRSNLMPLVVLPALLYFVRRSWAYVLSSVALLAASLSWNLFAIATVQGLPGRAVSTMETARYYLFDMPSFFSVLWRTLSHDGTLLGYWYMFVGILGWLDTPLDAAVYLLMGILLAALAVLTLERSRARILDRGPLSLFCATTACVLLLFAILLVTVTPHPAKLIEGVQGRYFTCPAICLGFCAFNRQLTVTGKRIGLLLLFLTAALSIFATVPKLLGRYWL